MPRKPNPPPDDKKQSRRFVETAKALEVDESGKRFESAIKIIAPPNGKPQKSKPT